MNYLHWNLNATLWLFLLIVILCYQLRLIYVKRIIAKDCEKMQNYKLISINILESTKKRYECNKLYSFKKFFDYISNMEAVQYEVKAMCEKYPQYEQNIYSKNMPKALEKDFYEFYENYYKIQSHFANTSFTYDINVED